MKDRKPCNKCFDNHPCGCEEKHNDCGCGGKKVDLLCSNYTGPTLPNSGIPTGETGNEAIVKLDKYIKSVQDSIETEDVLIESIGDKIPIYKGLSEAFVHQIKSIKGESGVTVENVATTAAPCAHADDYINVYIDKDWLKNQILHWFQSGEIDLCQLTSHCTPPVPRVAPVVTDFSLIVPFNSGSRTFTASDFNDHFSDADGDLIDYIKFMSGAQFNTFNGTNVVTNSPMDFVDVSSGALRFFVNPAMTSGYTQTIEYLARDTGNMDSNIANITITVTPKIYVTLDPTTVTFQRGIQSTQGNVMVTYSNATGGTPQTLAANAVLYDNGIPSGQPGHLKITNVANVVLSGTGSFTVKVVHYPLTTAPNTSVNYIIDGSTGTVILNYFSIPETQDIVKNLNNRTNSGISKTIDLDPIYFDFDSDAMESIIFYNSGTNTNAVGPNSVLRKNGLPYDGNEVLVSNLNQIQFIAPNTNNASEIEVLYRVKDNTGKWSV